MQHFFDFYRDRRVLLTGHTGFKGSWLCRILQDMGAQVLGYALDAERGSAYMQIVDREKIDSFIFDIRDMDSLLRTFEKAKPEIVFHLAAQPIVLEAYKNPAYTFDVNIQGTVNLLECVRHSKTVKSVLVVTTDKVYRNNEWEYGYRENDILGDIEPYAASKACAEFVARSYFETYLRKHGIALSTARAGNVIGGGDISPHRIVPDCVRAAKHGIPIAVRNKHSVRPYQHVLEPLFAYLMIAEKQAGDIRFSGQYNIGPNEADCVSTDTLANIFCSIWGNNQTWNYEGAVDAPHESGLLKLDCSKIRAVFDWKPRWDVTTAIAKTIEWERHENKKYITDRQINEYMGALL